MGEDDKKMNKGKLIAAAQTRRPKAALPWAVSYPEPD